MTYTGHVKNGVIVLDDQAALPEGTEVIVTMPSNSVSQSTIAERLRNVIGKAEGLPPDASTRVDEYLYGDEPK